MFECLRVAAATPAFAVGFCGAKLDTSSTKLHAGVTGKKVNSSQNPSTQALTAITNLALECPLTCSFAQVLEAADLHNACCIEAGHLPGVMLGRAMASSHQCLCLHMD
jgi:hypothetical protein